MSRPKINDPRRRVVNFRLTDQELQSFEAAAAKKGFSSLSDYLRSLHEKDGLEHDAFKSTDSFKTVAEPRLFEETERGQMYLGDSLGLMHKFEKRITGMRMQTGMCSGSNHLQRVFVEF